MPQPERGPAERRRTSGTPAGTGSPSVVEYAIIAVLITAVAIGTWKTFGERQEPDPSLENAASQRSGAAP